MVWRVIVVAVAGILLLIGSALVFAGFDAHSHSASDTLRPFLITVGPGWAVAVPVAVAVLRKSPRKVRGR
jgi:hypothetical protein